MTIGAILTQVFFGGGGDKTSISRRKRSFEIFSAVQIALLQKYCFYIPTLFALTIILITDFSDQVFRTPIVNKIIRRYTCHKIKFSKSENSWKHLPQYTNLELNRQKNNGNQGTQWNVN